MDTLSLPCTVEIQAAAGADKAPTITGTCYGGGITSTVLGLGNMAFDLRGVTIPDAPLPLLSEHGDAIAAIVGQVTARIVGGQRIEFSGTLSRTTPAAQEVLPLAREGHQFQCSVGLADAVFGQVVRPGESIVLNGRKLTAGGIAFRVVKTCTLREISLVSVGADLETAVNIAAKAHFIKGVEPMLQQTAEPVIEQTVEAAAALETQRVSTITARAAHYSAGNPGRKDAIQAVAATATAGAATAAETEVALMRAARPAYSGVYNHGAAETPTPDVLAAAWLLHAGKSALAEKVYGPTVAEKASDLRCHSSLDLLAAGLRANGNAVPRGRPELIRLAFSTSTCTAMGSAVEKVAIAAYEDTPQTWRSFCAVKSVPNFRTTTGIRPTFGGNLETLAPGGEVKHGTLGEETYDFAVHTEAKMLRLTREAVINDDLGLIQDTGAGFGQMAMRSLSDCVWRVILAGVSTGHFAAGRANYLTGGTSVLGIGGLTLAVAALRNQRDIQNNDLDLRPAALVVPSELEMIGRQLLESAEVLAVAAGDPMGNALKGLASLQVESRLSNLIKFPVGASASGWFLFAGPQASPVIVAFLDGREQPTLEFYGLDNDPQTLGVTWRIFHDYGAANADYRAGVRSDGV